MYTYNRDSCQKKSGKNLPIAVTSDIGHGMDSKGIVIGQEIHLKE